MKNDYIMKICLLTPRFPFPENGGDVLRINNIARYLKRQGHDLILVSFYDQDHDMDEACKLYDKIIIVTRRKIESFFFSLIFMICGRPIQCGYYHSKRFAKKFREVIDNEHPDRYIAHLLRMAPYLESNDLNADSTVEMTDALSKTYSLSSNATGGMLKKNIYKIERRLIKKYETHVINVFPKVVVVSQTDIDFLHQYVDNKSLALHTNGVDCLEHISGKYDSNKICFIGNMRTLQNQDAVIRFVKYILPGIVEHNPETIFYVVGAEPSREIKSLDNGKNVIVTGFVDDLMGFISDSCMAVAPVTIAAGIQNKVLVAMGCGIPVVMTSLISRAIPELVDGDNCFIRDDNASFAQACIAIMDDSKIRNNVALNGFEMVQKCYSWNEKLRGY